MVKQAKKQTINNNTNNNTNNNNTNNNINNTNNNNNTNITSKGCFSSVKSTYAHALTVRPISMDVVRPTFMTVFLFSLLLYVFYTLAFFLSVSFIAFGKDMDYTYGKIVWFASMMYGIFILSSVAMGFIFTLWSHKPFSSFLLLSILSTGVFAPISVLIRFVPVAGYIVGFFFIIVMSYYNGGCLQQIYAPVDQREAIIQSAIGFMMTLAIYTILNIG
ncbi:hypothetical protein EHP00_2395 [Ecytonucleospora hepatopenaei]|uniref:Uncharacterized protein n=1 Tax=Ecytonucleospora hepatopenaei TaxID=646526 RepID=A0A1W0E326_9MICR|nr:hypothetical protein EHP00_2395 [Ecytonucleospora hepatopenaei]